MKSMYLIFQSLHLMITFNFPAEPGTGFIQHMSRCSSDAIDLVTQMCTYDADNRISALQALGHPYFASIRYDYFIIEHFYGFI
jgi:serine/threonine protein kinase